MDFFAHVITHACLDSLKILPFLFIALLLMEGLEHYTGSIPETTMKRMGKTGPVVGALTGCIPQCGFSVAAAGLYAEGYLSRGTLLAVFLASSDEALLIILATPGHVKLAFLLLAVKICIAVIAGYTVDYLFPTRAMHHGRQLREPSACQCSGTFPSMLKTAGKHTAKLFLFLFLFTVAINFFLVLIGEAELSRLLLNDTLLQPLMAAAVGMIPNCIPSVLLTQLYLEGMLSFSSLISGLCANAGLGLLMLFKAGPDKKENVRFVIMLYLTSALSGFLLMALR